MPPLAVAPRGVPLDALWPTLKRVDAQAYQQVRAAFPSRSRSPHPLAQPLPPMLTDARAGGRAHGGPSKTPLGVPRRGHLSDRPRTAAGGAPRPARGGQPAALPPRAGGPVSGAALAVAEGVALGAVAGPFCSLTGASPPSPPPKALTVIY